MGGGGRVSWARWGGAGATCSPRAVWEQPWALGLSLSPLASGHVPGLDFPEETAVASCEWCRKSGEPLASFQDSSNSPTGPARRLRLSPLGGLAVPLACPPSSPRLPLPSQFPLPRLFESLVSPPPRGLARVVPSSRHTLPSPLSPFMSAHVHLLQEAPLDCPLDHRDLSLLALRETRLHIVCAIMR